MRIIVNCWEPINNFEVNRNHFTNSLDFNDFK